MPCLAWWPGTIAPGRTSAGLASELDLFPTCLDLAGAKIPDDRPIDGVSLAPLLGARGPSPRTHLFYYHGAELFAVRRGPVEAPSQDDQPRIRPGEAAGPQSAAALSPDDRPVRAVQRGRSTPGRRRANPQGHRRTPPRPETRNAPALIEAIRSRAAESLPDIREGTRRRPVTSENGGPCRSVPAGKVASSSLWTLQTSSPLSVLRVP